MTYKGTINISASSKYRFSASATIRPHCSEKEIIFYLNKIFNGRGRIIGSDRVIDPRRRELSNLLV